MLQLHKMTCWDKYFMSCRNVKKGKQSSPTIMLYSVINLNPNSSK